MTAGDSAAMIQGAEVFDRDGERIGAAADPGGDYFMVEEGMLFVKAFYLPRHVIARVDTDGVRLRVSKAEAEAMGREEPPGEGDPWLADTAPDEPAVSR